MKARMIPAVALAALLLALPAPAPAALKVVATLSDLGRVVEAVGGDDVEVTVLCPSDRDPHYLPAKPSLARKVGKADLLVYNGLELEIAWLPLLIEKARNPRVGLGSDGLLDCSEAVDTVLEVPAGGIDRGQGDIHPEGNPHYTLDPRRMAAVAHLVAHRLGLLDPDGAAAYAERAAAFAALMAANDARWRETAAAAAGLPVVIYRKHWEYLADWLGLEIVGEIEHRPGIAPSPRHIQQMIDLAEARGGVIVLGAAWDHPDALRDVARRMRSPLIQPPGHCGDAPGAAGYVAFLDEVSAALAGAAAELEERRSAEGP